MRTVAISCVRDEVDIVEPFVRHTLSHVDRLVVLDNGSTDGTRALLQRLVAEGLPLEVVDDPAPGHYQWRRMTHLMQAHAIRRHAADWIVPLDGDEFLATEKLAAVLERESGDEPISVCWQTYVPVSHDDPGEKNPVLRIRHRLREEAHSTLKVLVPAKIARKSGMSLAQGSHQLNDGGRPVTARRLPEVSLAHFPGRGPAQFARKVVVKHLQYLAMDGRHPSWGFHYRASVELLRRNVDRFSADLQRSILHYNLPEGESFDPELVVAPLDYRGGPLRYTPADADRSIVQALLECAEMIARGHRALARERRMLAAEVDALKSRLQRDEAAVEAGQRSWVRRIGRTATRPVRWAKRHLAQVAGTSPPGGPDPAGQARRAA